MSLRRSFSGSWLGNRRFWATVDAIAEENRAAGRPFKTDEQWARMLTAAKATLAPHVTGLPEWTWMALLRNLERNAEARDLGIDEQQQYRDELAADRANRARESAARPMLARPIATSSRGRTRLTGVEKMS
jgi:hypothetical protein